MYFFTYSVNYTTSKILLAAFTNDSGEQLNFKININFASK